MKVMVGTNGVLSMAEGIEAVVVVVVVAAAAGAYVGIEERLREVMVKLRVEGVNVEPV